MVSIKKNFFYNALLTVFNSLLPAISFPYVSRILLAEGVGKAQFAFSLAQYFVIFASLGIPIYGIREIARNRHDKQKLSDVFWEIFIINIIASILVSALYVAIILNSPALTKSLSVYLIASPIVFLSFLNIDWFYSGLEKFKQIAIRSIFIKLLSLIAIFIFVRKAQDVASYMVILVVSALANQFWNWWMLRKEVVPSVVAKLSLKPHIKPIFITFGVLFAVSLYTVFDTVLLGIISNNSSVGYYSAATKLNRLVIPVITALGVVLTPRLSLAMEQKDHTQIQNLIDKSFWGICYLAVPASIGLYLFAEEIILVFAGPDFSGAILPMRLMSPLALIVGLAHLFSSQVLIPGKREQQYLIAVMAGCSICVLLNLILVPTFQSNGAAIVNTITEFLIALLSFYFVTRYFSIRISWMLLIEKIIYTVIVFYTVYALTAHWLVSPLYRLLVGVPLCAVAYFLISLLVENDKMLKQLVHEQLNRFK